MYYDDKVKIDWNEGQVKGISRMMEEGQDCKDVITQLSASRSSIGVIVSANLIECIQEAEVDDSKAKEEIIKEVVELLVKSR